MAVATQLGIFSKDFQNAGELVALAHFLTCPITDIFVEPEVARDPPQAQQHDPGRSFQFQHFVAAHFAQVGLDVTFEQEPDTRLVVPNLGTIGLAAKRLKSLKKLQANLKDAAKQISCQNLCGLVALDFTIAFDLHRKVFFVNSFEETHVLHPALDLALRSGAGARVAQWVRESRSGQAARGVIGHAAVLVYVRSTQTLGSAHLWYGGPVWAPDAIGWEFLRNVTGSIRTEP